MVATQVRRSRQLPQTSARHVREMLLNIAYCLHATKAVKRLPTSHARRPVQNGLGVVS